MKQGLHTRFVGKFTILLASLAAFLPLLVGCQDAAGKAALFSYSGMFLADMALTPVRSFLGTQALNIINSL